MPDYIFKTYIDSGREYYEYTDAADREQTIKKDFPFPESLMELLYMDTQELEAITKKMDKALLAFYQSGAKDDLQVVAAGLNELASRHVYFELLRLDWTERLKAAERVTPKEYLRLLPHKKISHIYSNIDVIDRRVFAEVLYPKDIYDLIDHHIRECVKREVRMRVCKNCLRYFAVTGKASTEYCDRVCDSKGRTCREIGAINTWTQRKQGDEVFKEYRREYKKRFARINAGRLTKSAFYAWSEEARRKKEDCDGGVISPEEFSRWLKES